MNTRTRKTLADLKDITEFATKKGILDKPFEEVLDLYNKEKGNNHQ